MLWQIIGYSLGAIFIGFVGGAAYKLWCWIPFKKKEKSKDKQEQEGGY